MYTESSAATAARVSQVTTTVGLGSNSSFAFGESTRMSGTAGSVGSSFGAAGGSSLHPVNAARAKVARTRKIVNVGRGALRCMAGSGAVRMAAI